jgi:hypothetical protein
MFGLLNNPPGLSSDPAVHIRPRPGPVNTYPRSLSRLQSLCNPVVTRVAVASPILLTWQGLTEDQISEAALKTLRGEYPLSNS